VRDWCTIMDPRRADSLRHPLARLYGEYVWAYVSAIQRARMAPAERVACYRYLVRWLASRARPTAAVQSAGPRELSQPRWR
jgi:hypothetical protein